MFHQETSSPENIYICNLDSNTIMQIADKEQLQRAVYEIVKLIPPGRATSYGAIAKAIGFPNLSRMVGRIMSQCNSDVNHIPAHRVVNSLGILSAKDAFGIPGQMQQLLESEGIVVTNDRIQNWKNVFWNPLKEL